MRAAGGMGRRELLTDDERRLLFGSPPMRQVWEALHVEPRQNPMLVVNTIRRVDT